MEVAIRLYLSGSDGEAAHAAALVGGELAMMSKRDVAEGRLVHVLPGWGTGEREIPAVTPAVDHKPRSVVRLIEHVRTVLDEAALRHRQFLGPDF